MATSSSSSVMPSVTSRSSSPRIRSITSPAWSGWVPAYIWNAPAVGVRGDAGVHRVGEAATLADLLEQPARQTAAEDVVDDVERLAVVVAAGQGPPAHDDVHLLGVVVDRLVTADQPRARGAPALSPVGRRSANALEISCNASS